MIFNRVELHWKDEALNNFVTYSLFCKLSRRNLHCGCTKCRAALEDWPRMTLASRGKRAKAGKRSKNRPCPAK